ACLLVLFHSFPFFGLGFFISRVLPVSSSEHILSRNPALYQYLSFPFRVFQFLLEQADLALHAGQLLFEAAVLVDEGITLFCDLFVRAHRLYVRKLAIRAHPMPHEGKGFRLQSEWSLTELTSYR